MSLSSIPVHAVQRALHKRARRRVYPSLAAPRTALLVVDMQQHYREGIPGLDAILPAVRRLADTLRARGCTVVWLLNTLERDGQDLWPHYHRHFFTPARAARHRAGLASGSPGHALLPELVPAQGDLVLEKTRFSAFAPGSSDLSMHLQARGIDSVVIVGVATNVCCESTARDAMMRDLQVVVVDDAMRAVTAEDHRGALAALYPCFADVCSADEVIAAVRPDAAP